MRPPDVLPLFQLLSPGDEFRDDVVHGLHLFLNSRFETVALTNTGFSRRETLDLSDCLIVEILIESAQHLGRYENFGIIWLFHIADTCFRLERHVSVFGRVIADVARA